MKNKHTITYKTMYPDFPLKEDIDYKSYRSLIEKFFKRAFELIMQGEEFVMPFGLGSLYVTKTFPDKPPVDYGTSNKYKKKIVHNNYHTEGFVLRVKWKKKRVRKLNLSYYRFKLTKSVRKEAVKIFTEGTYLHKYTGK